MHKRIIFVLLGISMLLVAGCREDGLISPGTQSAGEIEPQIQDANQNGGIIPLDAQPHGKSYAEWSVAWWQWLFSIPYYENPGLDPDGGFVALNQSGQVWFLAPNYGGGQVDERWATIPTGKMLFIDVAAFLGTWAAGDPQEIDELIAVITEVVDNIGEIEFEIDGELVENITDYRVQSPIFDITFPVDNVFGLEPGTYSPTYAEGYYVMLAPLSAGEHTIHILADLGPIYGTSEVTFHLTVAGGRGRHFNQDH